MILKLHTLKYISLYWFKDIEKSVYGGGGSEINYHLKYDPFSLKLHLNNCSCVGSVINIGGGDVNVNDLQLVNDIHLSPGHWLLGKMVGC